MQIRGIVFDDRAICGDCWEEENRKNRQQIPPEVIEKRRRAREGMLKWESINEDGTESKEVSDFERLLAEMEGQILFLAAEYDSSQPYFCDTCNKAL
jgi:hypothetical protein